MLSEEEKDKILDTLRRDRKFRYAIMGMIGFSELLERFARIEERQQKLEERQQRLEERFARLEERQQKLEERQQRLEERFAKLEDRFAKLEERFARIEERQQKLEERQQRLEERFIELYKTVEEIRRRQELMALELGALTESFYSKSVYDDIKEAVRESDDEIVARKRNAKVDSEEVDVLIVTRKKVYAVEVKVKPKIGDVGSLLAKGDLVKRKYKGKEMVLVLAGAMVGSDVEEYAKSKGIEVYTY